MKRYVNFMSNPDEDTAIDQFGKGDKYFGVAVMMATLPGLPMFGHGQVEGFTEKYGMEYQRPRYEEWPDQWLIDRHNREITPLLKRRWMFAESAHFLLYDFFSDAGWVDENVFAYSNRSGGGGALIIYHNHYGTTHGTVRISAAYADKGAGQLRQRSLWEGLGLNDRGSIVTWRDSLTGLEYLRRGHDIADGGLTVGLHAYQSYVFLDWREIYATADKCWDRLCDHLAGRGVPNLEDALIGFELLPVHNALRAALDPALISMLAGAAEVPAAPGTAAEKKPGKKPNEFLDAAGGHYENLLPGIRAAWTRFSGERRDARGARSESALGDYRTCLRGVLRLLMVEALMPAPGPGAARRVLPASSPEVAATALWGPVMAWCLLQVLAEAIDGNNIPRTALDLFDRLRLREPLAQSFNALGLEGEEGWRAAARIKVLLMIESGGGQTAPQASPAEKTSMKQTKAAEVLAAEAASAAPAPSASRIPAVLWQDPDVRWLTGYNESGGHAYVVRERYEELLWWLALPELLKLANMTALSRAAASAISRGIAEQMQAIQRAGYRVDVLLQGDKGALGQPDATRCIPAQSCGISARDAARARREAAARRRAQGDRCRISRPRRTPWRRWVQSRRE